MAHYEINHYPTPIRLFKSNFLEFFTHISPIAVTIIWLPFAGYMLTREIMVGAARGVSLWYVPAAFLCGLFLWTLTEYTMHRFVFHYPPETPAGAPHLPVPRHPPSPAAVQDPPGHAARVQHPLALVFYRLFSLVVGVCSPRRSGSICWWLVLPSDTWLMT